VERGRWGREIDELQLYFNILEVRLTTGIGIDARVFHP
jgi:hypothetical protein